MSMLPNHNEVVIGKRLAFVSKELSRTKQSFRDETDINVLFKRFAKQNRLDIDKAFISMGILASRTADPGMHVDISEVPTFQDCLNIVADANRRFEVLPSAIRERFDNDPGKLLDFLYDPINKDEATKLGFFKDPVPPVAPLVPPVAPPVPPVAPPVPPVAPPVPPVAPPRVP